MKEAKINIAEDINTNVIADKGFSLPDGISRCFVRGLSLSIFASAIRLNPIAADLAPAIAIITHKISAMFMGALLEAKTIADNAKGSANRV